MKSNKSKRSRRSYDAAFKQDVLKMVESGRSVLEVAHAIGFNQLADLPLDQAHSCTVFKASRSLFHTYVRRGKR